MKELAVSRQALWKEKGVTGFFVDFVFAPGSQYSVKLNGELLLFMYCAFNTSPPRLAQCNSVVSSWRVSAVLSTENKPHPQHLRPFLFPGERGNISFSNNGFGVYSDSSVLLIKKQQLITSTVSSYGEGYEQKEP